MVASIASYIAWKQWQTAEEKRKNDLFDKRYEIYEKVVAFIINVISGEQNAFSSEALLTVKMKSGFLFDEKIEKYIDDLYKESVEIWYFYKKLEDNNLQQDKRNEIAEKLEVSRKYFMDQSKSIGLLFMPFLKMK